MDKLKMAIQEVKDLRISDERKAEVEKMDKWFYGLPTNSQADWACRFWNNATYKQKAEEYYID